MSTEYIFKQISQAKDDAKYWAILKGASAGVFVGSTITGIAYSFLPNFSWLISLLFVFGILLGGCIFIESRRTHLNYEKKIQDLLALVSLELKHHSFQAKRKFQKGLH